VPPCPRWVGLQDRSVGARRWLPRGWMDNSGWSRWDRCIDYPDRCSPPPPPPTPSPSATTHGTDDPLGACPRRLARTLSGLAWSSVLGGGTPVAAYRTALRTSSRRRNAEPGPTARRARLEIGVVRDVLHGHREIDGLEGPRPRHSRREGARIWPIKRSTKPPANHGGNRRNRLFMDPAFRTPRQDRRSPSCARRGCGPSRPAAAPASCAAR